MAVTMIYTPDDSDACEDAAVMINGKVDGNIRPVINLFRRFLAGMSFAESTIDEAVGDYD